jgi:hypothetical protein
LKTFQPTPVQQAPPLTRCTHTNRIRLKKYVIVIAIVTLVAFTLFWAGTNLMHPNQGFSPTLSGKDTVNITFQTVPTNVTGLLTVDGNATNTPHTFQWTVGSVHNISAASNVTGDGVRYVWRTWSGGYGQNYTLLTPSSPMVYIATFERQYRLQININPEGGGVTTPPAGVYWLSEGQSIIIQAMPNNTYAFSSWIGSEQGGYNSTFARLHITMTNPATETAYFNSQTNAAPPQPLPVIRLENGGTSNLTYPFKSKPADFTENVNREHVKRLGTVRVRLQ